MRTLMVIAIAATACKPPPIEETPPMLELGAVEVVGAAAGVLREGRLYGYMAHLIGQEVNGEVLALGAVVLQNTSTRRANLGLRGGVIEFPGSDDSREVRIESGTSATYTLAPTLDLAAVAALTEPATATLEVVVTIDGVDAPAVTAPLEVSPRSVVPFRVGEQDLRGLAVVSVVPSHPEVLTLLRQAERIVPDGGLNGYDGDEAGVVDEMAAVYSVISDQGMSFTSLEVGFFDDEAYVAGPDELLAAGEGTVVDGAMLLAGAFEAIGLETYITYLADHMLVAARTSPGGALYALDPAMVGVDDFIAAAGEGARRFEEAAEDDPDFLAVSLALARESGFAPMP